jgi:hypothetical protein
MAEARLCLGEASFGEAKTPFFGLLQCLISPHLPLSGGDGGHQKFIFDVVSCSFAGG